MRNRLVRACAIALSLPLALGGVPTKAFATLADSDEPITIEEDGVSNSDADDAVALEDEPTSEPERLSDDGPGTELQTESELLAEPELQIEPELQAAPNTAPVDESSPLEDVIAVEAEESASEAVPSVEAIEGIDDAAGLSAQAETRNIAQAKASIAAQAYTGKRLKPTPTVKWGATTLRKGTDYRITSYGTNVENGKKGNWVKIKGIGQYTGTKTISFNIKRPNVLYRVHRQTYGWEAGWRSNGKQSGTTGQSKRLEGIYIKVNNSPVSGSIAYRTHVQKIGWQAWKDAGKMAGTSGKALRLEAIQIKLTGKLAKKYDVWYRVHAQHFGWMGWAKNGASAGSEGYAYRLESIQIVIQPKGSPKPGIQMEGASTTAPATVMWCIPMREYYTYLQQLFENRIAFIRHPTRNYKTLASLGINETDDINAWVDSELYNFEEGLIETRQKMSKLKTPVDKAIYVCSYVTSRFPYSGDASSLSALAQTKTGDCWALSAITQAMLRKLGVMQTWLCVPGRPIAHSGNTPVQNDAYNNSNHRTVIMKIGKAYYDVDATINQVEQISTSYANYLLGKSDSYSSFV